MSRLRLHLISCRVFEREIEVLARTARTDLHRQFLEIALHEKPGCQLGAALQAVVDAVSPDQHDAIALGYGLCNRGLIGLQARKLPVVIPRAHDCLGLLLGSSRRYLAAMEAEPATYFQSSGWIEHLPADRMLRSLATEGTDASSVKRDELVKKYGEENAQFLLDELTSFTKHYQRLAFISTPVNDVQACEARAAEIAQSQGWKFEKLPGDLGWLQRLLDGEWSGQEFMVLQPGERIALRYDGQLIGAEPA